MQERNGSEGRKHRGADANGHSEHRRPSSEPLASLLPSGEKGGATA